MLVRHSLIAAVCTLPLATGCFSFDRSYLRSCASEPMKIARDGEELPFNKTTCIEVYGEPTYTIEQPDGEVCIWRDVAAAPHLNCNEHWIWIVRFDEHGEFLPADLHADYGLCPRCGYDLRNWQGKTCPDCGAPRG